MGAGPWNVRVDHELCSGMGYCVKACGEVFELRADDARSWVREDVDWSTVDRSRVEDAVLACPWEAISADGR